MKRFFTTVFRITTFQVLVIGSFILLKFVINRYNLNDTLQRPMIWVLLAAGFVFILSVGISGIIENKQDITEPETTRRKFSRIEKRYSGILNSGIWIPSLIATALFLYMVIPTTLQMFFVFLIGLFLRNLVEYIQNKPATVEEEKS